MVKRVLITGAIGFIGSHTVEHILKNTDWDVVGLIRGSNVGDVERVITNPAVKPYLDRLTLVRHDLLDKVPEHIDKRIGHIDYVIHLAANSHVDRSITNPAEFAHDNVIGTVNLLEWARARQQKDPIEKFINAGTDEVFGPVIREDGKGFDEESPFHPSNPYSGSKVGQVAMGESYWVTYKLPIITTFMVNIFGERQNPEKLITKTMRKLLSGEPMTVHCRLIDNVPTEIGIRCWMHARSAADAYLFLLQHGEPGQRYNVEAGVQLDNLTIINKIGKILGIEPKLEFIDFHKSRPGHDRIYGLNGDKIRALGWTQTVSFDEALEHTVKWTLEHKEEWL